MTDTATETTSETASGTIPEKTEALVAPEAVVPAHVGWSIPRPAEIPRPTYLPAVMAFGITFFLWGFVSSPVVLVIGLLVAVTALVGWIGEMRHDD